MTVAPPVGQTETKWKRYPAYKDSGVEWLGEVPAHWSSSKVKYVADYINGAAFKPTYWSDEGLKIIRIQNLSDPDADYNYYNGHLHSKYLIQPGDILISWSASLDVYIWEDEPAWLNQHIFKAVPDEDVVVKDHFSWLAQWFIQELQKDAHGSTMQHLTKDKFGSFGVYLPPLEEQAAIAAFLDRETERIDTLIAKKERLIELLQEKRTALISHAVTKGLDPEVEMKQSGIPALGRIPTHWEIEQNKRVFEEVDERSVTGREELLSVSHITGVTPRSEKEVYMFMAETLEGYKICQPDDLVINTMWAWMGALGISKNHGVVSPSYNVYRLRDRKRFLPDYLDLLYRTPGYVSEINRYSKGVWTSRLRLYPDEFFNMLTIVPPIAEQKQIVKFISDELAPLGVLSGKLKSSTQAMHEYRTALISAAVTGKIDVRDARPSGGLYDATNG